MKPKKILRLIDEGRVGELRAAIQLEVDEEDNLGDLREQIRAKQRELQELRALYREHSDE